MADRQRRIGLVGTFDVENFGDVLFPLIARHELAARIPGAEIVPFSYHARDPSSWPYEVRPLSELGACIDDLDIVLVGGGHLIRFDKTVAFGYQPPGPDLHHPTAYWLMPTLLGRWTGVPVAWNAVGASPGTPAWAEPLLAEACRSTGYLAVRDEPSAAEIRRVAPDVDPRLVPDTAFGLGALDAASSREALQLRDELGLAGPYVVYQPSPDLAPFQSWLTSAVGWYAGQGLTIVELPIGPCLGDRVGIVDVATPTVSATGWPTPLALAGVVAGADAVIARSLHLSIAALVAGVPVVRRTSDPGSKYRVLDGLRGVHVVPDDELGTDHPLPLGREAPAEDVRALTAALGRHWDAIASLVGDRPASRATTLAEAIGRVTHLEELTAERALDSNRFERAFETATAELELERSRGFLVEQRIADRDERLRRLEDELRDLERRLDEMETSKSWRLTQPLRSARAALPAAVVPSPSSEPTPADSDALGSAPEPDLQAAQAEEARRKLDREPPEAVTRVPLLEDVADLPVSPVRKVAFYLPQFHPIPENDRWWGRGFTEWTNVTRAEPLFEGHDQPHRPGELGYYDLRVVETQRRQVELARLYGIDAFCFHFYWFGGRRLLERPLERYLADPTLDLPFCLCWANESWSRRWDGRDDDLLIEQRHSETDDLAFIDYVTRYLDDPRYVRVDDRPLLVVYRPGVLPDARATVARWRDRYRRARGGELFVAHTTAFDDDPPEAYGCDASIEFPPVRLGASNPPVPPRVPDDEIVSLSEERPHVFDGRFFVDESRRYTTPDRLLFRGVCPGWDNTPRRGKDAYVLWNTAPAGFQTWLRNALVETEERLPAEQRLVFVNAWNEWGESCYLEPDERRGYAYLEAVRVASVRAAVRPSPADARTVRAAAIVHATDASSLAELLDLVEALDRPPDLLLTTRAGERDAVETELGRRSLTWRLEPTDEPGDLLPFLRVLDSGEVSSYDVVLRLRTTSAADLDDLLESGVVRDVLEAFERQPQLGLVGPVTDRVVLGETSGPAETRVYELASRLGVTDVDLARDTTFASGCYFVRPTALAPLRAIQLDDGAAEAERALNGSVGFSVIAAGYRIEDTRSFRRVVEAVPSETRA